MNIFFRAKTTKQSFLRWILINVVYFLFSAQEIHLIVSTLGCPGSTPSPCLEGGIIDLFRVFKQGQL